VIQHAEDQRITISYEFYQTPKLA